MAVFLTIWVVATVALAGYWFDTRRRLRRYENEHGEPYTVRVPDVEEPCPNCGSPLHQALIEDNHGPELELASLVFVHADGSPVYSSWPISDQARTRLMELRGVGPGAWCKRCEDFFFFEASPMSLPGGKT